MGLHPERYMEAFAHPLWVVALKLIYLKELLLFIGCSRLNNASIIIQNW
jgi:hypothetical protein